MAKQLNVSLSFSAETGQAKAQMADLQNSLKQLTANAGKASGNNFGLTKDLAQASTKVVELQSMLEGCKTAAGGLDLAKFSQSMSQSNTSIKEYASALSQLGPQGEQAFAKLARSISQAEIPMRKANGVLAEFATTLKNTARWQISSSILHGFMGTVQSAYHYAQDLNESLNNIRIVTGQTTEQMDAFAAKANAAAKALSTSTTAYTDAALIFYQQGLDDKTVEERTNVTIKMAHAAGESATEVSSYMTAIWNNFDDGSKSLEYYGDVMAKLGAKTAASSAEIAAGLEKFASIGDTVGLSYEYATAAVATIVDKTRQSADTVGTALKTIFARLQGLQLGETLEDGVDLNKYSKALQTVGVQVLDLNGNMREADDIIYDLGMKWETLSSAQQTALAQTVAGTRQYTQLMSLMNNFDSFQQNVSTAETSEGTLQEQADIYAESWEAARERVGAAAEEIYTQLLNDDFFISLSNGFAEFLNIISNTIDSLGGLPGILSMVSGLMLKIYGKDMLAAMQRWKENFQFKHDDNALEKMLQERRKANEELRQMFVNSADDGPVNQTKGAIYTEQANLQDTLITKQQELLAKGTQLTAEEQRQANLMLDINEQMGQRAIKAAEDLQAQERINASLENQAKIQIKIAERKGSNRAYSSFEKDLKVAKQLQAEYGTLQALSNKMSKGSSFKGTVSSLNEMSKAAKDAGISFERIDDILEQVANGTITDMETLSNAVEAAMLDVGADGQMMFDQISSKAEQAGVNMKEFSPILEQMRQSFAQTGSLTAQQIQTLKDYGINVEEVSNKIKGMQGPPPTIGQGFMALGQTLSSTAMMISSIKGLFDTWNNQDMSFGEKLISTFTTLGMVIPMVTTAFNAQNLAQIASIASSVATAVAKGVEAGAWWATTVAAIAAQTAMSPLLIITLAITLAIGILVGVIALLVTAFKNMEANSPEGQLKAAKEEAKKTAEALNEAKEAANELKSAFDNYDSIVEELNNCTKGTEEWASALQAVNNEVLTLLQEYPELSQYVTRNADGMLEISEAGKDYMQQMADQKVLNAQAANNQAQQNVRDKQIDVYKSDNYDELYYNHWAMDDQGYDRAGDVANYINDNASDFAGMTDSEIKDALTEYFEANNIDVSQVDEWTTAVSEMRGDLQELGAAVDANTLATEMENQAMADNILANNERVQNSANAEQVMKASGDIYGAIYDNAYDDYLKKAQSRGAFNSKNADSEEMWKEYAKLQGIDESAITNYKGSGKDASFVYENDEGEEVEVSAASVAAVVAAAEANEQLAAAAENLVKKFAELDASTDIADKALKDFLVDQNFEGATEAEFAAMKEKLGGDNMTNESIEKYLDEEFGDGKDGKISDETAQKYGYESAEAMVKAFSDGVKNYDTALEDVGKDLLQPVKQVFDAMDKSELSVKGQEAVADVMQNAFVHGGAEGLAMITSAMDGMEADEAEAFATTLQGLDWNNMDAATLSKTLKQAGIATDFTTEQLNQMIDTMSDSRVVKDFDSLAEGFASLHEVADGLEFGDSISAEDFAVLGDEFESYFTRMADGTYKLTGDAEDFYEAVQEKSIEGFVQNIDKLKEQNAKLQAIKDFNFDDLSQTQYNGPEEHTYQGGDVNKQIQALDAMGYDAEQIARWNEDLADGSTSVETLQEIANAVAEYRGELGNLDQAIAANEQAIFNQEVAIATSYSSLKDLKQAYEEGTISAEAFSVAAMQLHEAESMDGLDAEEMNDYADHLMEIAESSDMVSDELADNEEAAEDVAKATMKLNRGIDKLADGFEDWSDVIENSDESSQEFAEAMSGMKDAMSDILGTSEDFISNDFIVEHLEEIEKAATGDEEAIRSLQRALSDDILCTVMGVSDFTQLDADLQNLQNEVWTLSNQDIEVGATLDQGEFINSANELIKNAGMTVDEAQAYFNSLGYEPEFVTEEQTVKRSIPQETTHTDYAITPGTLDIMGVEVPIPTVDRITTTRVTGYEELDEVIQVPALSADGTPQIKSLTRTNSGGSLSNYSSGNKGGKSPGSGGGKGGGGGGNKEVKDKKNLTDEKERYHEITNTIEDMQHALDRVSAAKDRAFGKAKIAKINEEIAAYDNLIAAQEQYVREIEDNYKKDKNTLAGYGASFDKNGNVDNYDQLMASQVQRYNDAVAIYNASAQTDADKEAFQAAEDYYEAFLEALNQYEETHDLKKEAQATLEDQINARYDLELEKIDYKVNLQIEFSDDELEHLEYLLERIEAKGFSAAEAIANLGQQTQSVMNKSDAYKEGIFSILGNHGLSDSDINAWLQGDEGAANKVAGLNLTEAEVEKLREYTAGLRDNNEALIEMRQAVHDKMLETFDEWNEKIDRNIDKLDHLKSMTESYRNIVDLVGKANFAGGAETIERLNASTVKQAGNYAQANIANRDRIAEQLQATRDAYAAQKDTISEEERKMWEDTIKEMEDQLNEAEEAAMGSIEEWMEAINQQFLDSVTNTMDKFADAVAGRFANLNELSEAFERQQSVNDRYLESYEKIYEFSKLNRDIEKSIDQTDNIKAKKELADLQAEINALEESGAEVSEYQMENLRKRYELKLAELALEEAQNAKSEVRMTRDNEGNWGYVYTADETQVAEAEQSYEDKLYELQQHNAEYINQLQESIITMQQEMYDKMQEIAADESLSIEERQAKMQEVQAYYQEQMGYYYSELELVLGNNKVLYEDDWQKYSDMTGYKISSDEEYVDSFDETAYSVLTGFQTMEDAQAAFNSASETMLDENLTAMDNWQTSMEDGPLKAMGSSFETLAEDIDRELGNIETESDNTTQEIEDDCDDSVDAYNGVIEAVIAWENQYSQSVDAMMDYSDNLIDKFNQVLALWADVKAAAEEAEDPPTPDDGGDDGGGGDNGGGGGGGGDGKPSWDRVVAAYNKINGGKWGNGLQNRINKGKSDGFTEAEVRAGQQLINYTYPPNLNGYGYSREKAKSLMGYDTGGYTGEWGDTSGRLALLHQKELVLNQEDTANILSAIDMIRQISSLIDLNAMSSMKGLGGMLAAGGVGQTMGGIEQHIEIHASFPDATDHSEIEEAFHNLLNSASQYANRKL